MGTAREANQASPPPLRICEEIKIKRRKYVGYYDQKLNCLEIHAPPS
jgi:hypothetical protein